MGRHRHRTNPLATFWLDVEYTRIASAFATAEISTTLLKGPAFDQLLFDGKRSRTYSDIDVLVDPALLAAAERVLEQRGFRRAERESAVRRLLRRAAIAGPVLGAAHATPWIRDRDGFTLDLHHTLPELGASAEVAWRALDAHRVSITVVDTRVQSLDRSASALLMALHAAHHGPRWTRARMDLQRAYDVLDRDCWDAAALLARELRAETAMGIGLGTVERGDALARELGLRTKPTLMHRLRWWSVAQSDRRQSPR
jgi:hypothetical protein